MIETLGTLPGITSFLLALFHPLGEAGFRVDESFTCITHTLRLSTYNWPMHNPSIGDGGIYGYVTSFSTGHLSPGGGQVVHERVFVADNAATARLAGDRPWRIDVDAGANGQWENARGVSLVPESPDVLAGAGTRITLPRALHLTAQGARGRRRAQSSRTARRHRRRRACTEPGDDPARDRDSHGRYAGDRPRPVRPRGRGYSDHDT